MAAACCCRRACPATRCARPRCSATRPGSRRPSGRVGELLGYPPFGALAAVSGAAAAAFMDALRSARRRRRARPERRPVAAAVRPTTTGCSTRSPPPRGRRPAPRRRRPAPHLTRHVEPVSPGIGGRVLTGSGRVVRSSRRGGGPRTWRWRPAVATLSERDRAELGEVGDLVAAGQAGLRQAAVLVADGQADVGRQRRSRGAVGPLRPARCRSASSPRRAPRRRPRSMSAQASQVTKRCEPSAVFWVFGCSGDSVAPTSQRCSTRIAAARAQDRADVVRASARRRAAGRADRRSAAASRGAGASARWGRACASGPGPSQAVVTSSRR